MNISIFYEKQDPYKIIRNLTYHIANVGVDLKEKTNRQDIDIAAFTYNDAKYIRKEIQVNNEDIYFLYIYLNIFSKDKKELEYLLNKIEGILKVPECKQEEQILGKNKYLNMFTIYGK